MNQDEIHQMQLVSVGRVGDELVAELVASIGDEEKIKELSKRIHEASGNTEETGIGVNFRLYNLPSYLDRDDFVDVPARIGGPVTGLEEHMAGIELKVATPDSVTLDTGKFSIENGELMTIDAAVVIGNADRIITLERWVLVKSGDDLIEIEYGIDNQAVLITKMLIDAMGEDEDE